MLMGEDPSVYYERTGNGLDFLPAVGKSVVLVRGVGKRIRLRAEKKDFFCFCPGYKGENVYIQCWWNKIFNIIH